MNSSPSCIWERERKATLHTPLYGMSLWSGSGLQAGNTELWPQTPSKTCLCPGTPRSQSVRVPLSRQGAKMCSPSPSQGGGGFTTHLSPGTLDTGLEFDTLHWRQKLLLELTTMSQSSILSRFWFQNDLQNVTKNRWKLKLGRSVIFYTLTHEIIKCFCCPRPFKITKK